MKKVTLILICGIVAVVLLILASLLYLIFAKSGNVKNNLSNPLSGVNDTSLIVIEERHVAYVLNEIGAYQLKNSLSSDKPRIEVVFGGEKFASEVNGGVISVKKGESENPDLRITTTRDEIIEAILSSDIKEYMKTSVSSGKTSIEMVAGYTTLLVKGYLSIYQEMTGKTLAGSVIRIFSS